MKNKTSQFTITLLLFFFFTYSANAQATLVSAWDYSEEELKLIHKKKDKPSKSWFSFLKKKSPQSSQNLMPPPNDHCSGALLLTPNNYCIGNFNASGATQSLPASTCSGITSAIVQDVWFKFVATDVSQYMEIVPSSGYDPVIEVRSGPNCNGTFIGCLDQGGGQGQTEIAWLNNATIGDTYFIRVYHYSSFGTPPSTTTFSVCVNLSQVPEDIYITNENVSPTTLNCGDPVTMSCDQNYSGTTPTSNLPSIDLEYWLSTNSTFEPNVDIYLADDASSIGSDDTYDPESETVNIPPNTPAGTYYILFVGDSDDEVAESNENNNVESVLITVNCGGGAPEDIFLTNLGVTPSSTTCGGTITINCTQNYSGQQLDANLPSFDVDYYLSSNTTFEPNIDYKLGGDVSGLGADDPYNNETWTGTIPASTPPGTHYIIFVADADHELVEVDEINNIQYLPITVNCAPNQYTVTTNSNPTNGGNTQGQGSYNAGTLVTVTATPNNGWTFVNWLENGSPVSSSPTYQFSINSNRNLTASFSQNVYAVTIVADPVHGGTTQGQGTYNLGDLVTVTATPNATWTFVAWVENGAPISNAPTYQFNINGNRNLIASFSQNAYSITATANPTNGGTITGTGSYVAGVTANLLATPTSGYKFDNWTENGLIVGTNPAYSFTVNSSRSLVVNFSLISTSAEEINTFSHARIYPNPVSNLLTIDLGETTNHTTRIRLFDTKGSLLKQHTFNGSIGQLSMVDLPVGHYIISLTNDLGQFNKRIVKY